MKISKVIKGTSDATTFNLEGVRPDGVTSLLPCVLFIPGAGECGKDSSKLYVNGPLKFSLGNKYVVLAAQPIPSWPPAAGDAPVFLRAVLKEIANGNYGVDPKQIILTGLSNGTATICEYIQYEDDANFVKPIAAIVMSMGWALSGDIKDAAIAAKSHDARWASIPTIGICGTADGLYTGMKTFFGELAAAKYPATFIQVTGEGHDGSLWNGFYNPTFTPIQLGGKLNIYDSALTQGNALSAPPVVVTPPPVVIPPPAKTIKSISTTYTYSDGSTEIITKP